MASTFVPSIQPVVEINSPVITEELSADFYRDPQGYSVNVDPASDLVATHNTNGLLLKLAPGAAPKSVVTTGTYDDLAKTITISVDGTTPVVINVAGLDDTAKTMVLTAAGLEIRNESGVVLSTVPLTQLDAQQLTGLAAASGYKLTLSNGGSVTITAPEVGMMFPAATPTATTELLTKDGKAVKPTELPVLHDNTWTKADGLKESVNGIASNIVIPAGTIVDTLGYDAAGKPVHQAATPAADFWRTTTGATLPNGANDTTEGVGHDGKVKIGAGTVTGDPKAALHVVHSGTSAVTPFGDAGALILSSNGAAKTYYESSGSPSGDRVMMMETANGSTKFSSVSDNGTGFVKADIFVMDHSSGDLFISGYPNTRNDAGTPVNVLTTSQFGMMESHPIADLLQVYSYKNPNPAPATWATPNSGGAPGGVIVDGTPAFRTQNANYVSPVTLPPVTTASVPIVIQCDSTFDLGIAPTNTTLPKDFVIKSGFCIRMVPGGDGKWHWIDSEVNPPAVAGPTGAATVSPTGLLSMGGQTIQLVKPTSSLGTPLNYWVFPA